MNSIGQLFRLTTFGESHGAAMGGVVDGMRPGISIDMQRLQAWVDRRRPGQSAITTQRSEADRVEVLSGIFEGETTGAPIGFIVRNSDQHSADYDNMRQVLRPSHADYAYLAKYGIRDHRGGGRSSARETVSWVVAGGLAMQALAQLGISVRAYTSQVGGVRLEKDYRELDLGQVDSNAVRCPDAEAAARMEALISDVKAQGDTIGGVACCVISGVPAGLGEPMFDKAQARLAAAMMSIHAAKGFEYGMGFEGCACRGSEMIDRWLPAQESGSCGVPPLQTATNHSGGIQGGITNGQDIVFRVAFKPVATLLRPVETVDIHGRAATLQARGRHDPCVLPRAVPVVESLAAMTIYDLWLLNAANGPAGC